ncbi:MAG TPA: hypothetical protein VJV79_35510 [Polyangiaceae bacterium]|nr:hypothetical protein [Polyangiaceae bacterium]
MISSARLTVLAMLFSACAPSNTEKASNTAADARAATFVYAPALERPHQERMRRSEEFSIPGSPLRNFEEWVLDWTVVVHQETNLFRRSMKLVGLKINVNGAENLRGDEVKANTVTIDVLTDKDSNVVDVRGTEQFSAAIVALGSEDVKPVLRRIFSPERLKALAIERSVELHSDFVGRPAQPGSTWMANDANKGTTRQIRVLAEAPCGASRCVQVRREYDVDRQALYADISQRVAAYVQSQGADASKVAVASMDLKLEDSLVIAPATMEYYSAKFLQDVNLRVTGPNGELPVKLKIERQIEYSY